jgi:hypothetical protein
MVEKPLSLAGKGGFANPSQLLGFGFGEFGRHVNPAEDVGEVMGLITEVRADTVARYHLVTRLLSRCRIIVTLS